MTEVNHIVNNTVVWPQGAHAIDCQPYGSTQTVCTYEYRLPVPGLQKRFVNSHGDTCYVPGGTGVEVTCVRVVEPPPIKKQDYTPWGWVLAVFLIVMMFAILIRRTAQIRRNPMTT